MGEPSERRRVAQPTNPSRDGRRGTVSGRDAIVIAIERPEIAVSLFDDVLFSDPVQRAAFAALAKAGGLAGAIEIADPEAGELLRRLAVSEVPDDLDPEGTYLALVRETAGRTLHELEAEGRVAERDGSDEGVVAVLTATGWLRGELELLQDPLVRAGASAEEMEVARRLVAWLVERHQEAAQ